MNHSAYECYSKHDNVNKSNITQIETQQGALRSMEEQMNNKQAYQSLTSEQVQQLLRMLHNYE